jgi:hypothetical protein
MNIIMFRVESVVVMATTNGVRSLTWLLCGPGLLLMSELWASEVAVMLAGLLTDPARALSIMAIYQTINGLYFMLPLGIGASAATR